MIGIDDVEELIKTIRLVYTNGSEKTKKYIKDWIDGIVIDKSTERDTYKYEIYLSCKFDEDKIVKIFDDYDDSEIDIEDLYEDELNMLYTYLCDLIDKLKIREEGCGKCKYYLHIRTPSGSMGICNNPKCPHYGYIGKYGCWVKFCDMMELEENDNED